ncbi:MAG: hypothetical protein ACOVOQ_13180, partial [Flavobacterium sp.]
MATCERVHVVPDPKQNKRRGVHEQVLVIADRTNTSTPFANSQQLSRRNGFKPKSKSNNMFHAICCHWLLSALPPH